MTIKELYEDACKLGLESCEVVVQYSDGGGFYSGNRDVELEYDEYLELVIL